MNAPPSVGPDRGPSSSLDLDLDLDRRFGGRRVRVGAAAVGVLALATALAVASGVGGERFADAVAAVVWPARPFVFFFAHFALVMGAWSLWRGRSAPADDADIALPAPADDAGAGDRLVGDGVDAALAALGDTDRAGNGWKRVDVERRIRGIARDVLDAETAVDDVSAALDSGEWTEDPRAAAYLGDDVALPVRIRVADWASGDPHRRKVEATVAELAAVAGVETEVAA